MVKVPPLISNEKLKEAGIIPVKKGSIRFAAGDPAGLTSNSWKVWTNKKGDVYLSCRDNFRETKVSLHASGRWRMGFTSQALSERPTLISDGENRAWEVWNQPTEQIPDTVLAFQLIFLTQELAVQPKQRDEKVWKGIFFIEEAPKGKITVVSLFITKGELNLVHENQPHFTLAILPLGNNRFAQIVAHAENEADYPEFIDRHRKALLDKIKEKGLIYTKDYFIYLFGHKDSGARFIIGARLIPANKHLLKLKKLFLKFRRK